MIGGTAISHYKQYHHYGIRRFFATAKHRFNSTHDFQNQKHCCRAVFIFCYGDG